MPTVKVLPKGQITLPKNIRKTLNVKEGDTILIEERDDQIILKKAKTIFDYAGSLPDLGIPIDDMIDQATTEEYKDNA